MTIIYKIRVKMRKNIININKNTSILKTKLIITYNYCVLIIVFNYNYGDLINN